MTDLVIVGAGGFGRETAWMVEQMPSWNLLGFYDDGVKLGTIVQGKKVVGSVSSLNEIRESLAVVIAVADPATRQRLAASLTNKKLSFPTLIHPAANVGHSSNRIGMGCIITAGVIMTTGSTVKDFVIINLATTIGHDVIIAEFTSVMPQCSISGNVKIGKKCLIGSGARILQGITIGEYSVVGAGAVVTKSFGDNAKLMGIPAVNKSDTPVSTSNLNC